MPSSTVRTFTDPDEYGSSIRGSNAELTITECGKFEAKLARVVLHHLWMQRFSDNLPRILHFSHDDDRAVISFRTQPGHGLRSNGLEMYDANIIRRRRGEEYFQSSSGSARFGAISLSIEQMASAGAAIAGCDLAPPKDDLTISPAPLALARLRRLHEAAGYLAEDAPTVIADPEAARGLEQALIEAMVDCLGPGEIEEDRRAQRQHAAIMRRFHRMVEENPDQALFIPQVCTAIGASARTLQICCQEHFGISPKHYLLLRRMHLVRRALNESTLADTTVTEIATRYGFWQFGRLAVEYKALFGEAPSATLHRLPLH
jgi:AraC-like DNA-binding protein